MADNMPQLELALEALKNAAERIGLKININKTQIMHAQRGLEHQDGNDIIAGLSLERVDNFVYLGSQLTPNDNIKCEVERRISSATRAFYALNKLFRTRMLSRRSKLRVLSTVVLPVLTFGAEAWSLTATLEQKLLRFENGLLKTICGPIYDVELSTWRRRYTREVRALTLQPLVTDAIRSARLRWLGHLIRAGPNRVIHKVFMEEMDGRRPRGRPRTRWKDVVMADLRLLGVNPESLEELARDRVGWRRLVVAAKGLNRPIAPGE